MVQNTTGPTPEELKELQNTPATQAPSEAEQKELHDSPTGERSGWDTALGYGKAAGSGVEEGLLRVAGTPVDTYNMVGDVVAGRGMAWLVDKLGASGAADWIRKNGYQDIKWGTGQSLVDDARRYGFSHTPETPGEAWLQSGISTAVHGGTLGALTGGVGALRGIAGATAESVAPAAALGAASASAGQAAAEAAPGVGKKLGVDIPPEAAAFLATVLTGGGVPYVAGRVPRPINTTYDEMGIKPTMKADVDPNATAPRPTRVGQQRAQDMHDQAADYAYRSLHAPDEPTPEGGYIGRTTQELGADIQRRAQQAVEDLKANTSAAYDELNRKVPQGTQVSTSNAQNAINKLVDRADNPDVAALMKNDAYQAYSDAMSHKQLSWNDMDLVRRKVGLAKASATDGEQRGLLDQLYKGLSDDMRNTADTIPGGRDAFETATKIAVSNYEKMGGVLDVLNNRASPETLPRYLMQQGRQGSTRMDDLMTSGAYPPVGEGGDPPAVSSKYEYHPSLGKDNVPRDVSPYVPKQSPPQFSQPSFNSDAGIDPNLGPARSGSAFPIEPARTERPFGPADDFKPGWQYRMNPDGTRRAFRPEGDDLYRRSVNRNQSLGWSDQVGPNIPLNPDEVQPPTMRETVKIGAPDVEKVDRPDPGGYWRTVRPGEDWQSGNQYKMQPDGSRSVFQRTAPEQYGPPGPPQTVRDYKTNLEFGVEPVPGMDTRTSQPAFFTSADGQQHALTEQGNLGRQLLIDGAKGPQGEFSLPKLMETWKTLSPEQRAALTRDPYIEHTMGNLERYWDSTGQSRAYANAPQPPRTPMRESTAFGTVMAAPAKAASYLGQRLSTGGVGIPGTNMTTQGLGPYFGGERGITGGQAALGTLGGLAAQSQIFNPPFPDVYHPPTDTGPPQPEKKDVMSFLSTGSPEQVGGFVGQRLGPQVAQQLAAAGPGGYRAALFQLIANPTSRRQLVGTG